MSRQITEELAEALHALVEATEAVEASPSDSQAARRAIERASVVSQLAQGFGERSARLRPWHDPRLLLETMNTR